MADPELGAFIKILFSSIFPQFISHIEQNSKQETIQANLKGMRYST